MKNGFVTISAAMALLICNAAITATAHEEDNAGVSGNLVMFLTQTDPMLAGHGLHFATRTVTAGRSATIILVGDAGRLALADWPSNASAVSGEALQTDLEAFVAAGGKVYITPYTLKSFSAAPTELIEGVSLPDNPTAIHAHMFESETQLLVW